MAIISPILLEGLVLVDKESDWTSFDVVAKIRSLTRVKKVGHCGTLDPLATGLLIVLVGKRFTKLQDQFLKQDKTYVCTAILGLESDTGEVTGELNHTATWDQLTKITKQKLKTVLASFRGETNQVPPNYSAIKIKGQKMYALARKGQELPKLEPRKIKIYSPNLDTFIVDKIKQKMSFQFTVSCSSGTYVRSLVSDIGDQLGCGATISLLRRTKIGNLDVRKAKTIAELEQLLIQKQSIFTDLD